MLDDHQAPIGWRTWRLRGERLWSWVMDTAWRPGGDEAMCLVARAHGSCHNPPGQECRCGFWALWEPLDCLLRARNENMCGMGVAVPARPVMGLMQGWGAVAVHDGEGFRAQYARVLCLFSDQLWDRELERLVGLRWWQRWTSFPGLRMPGRWGALDPDLARVADRHSVPLVRLGDSVRLGLLREFGVPERVLEPMESRLGRPP
ncbi:MAG: hypothetical protein J2P57_15205 [Acidimicrobiaceae bacterium]|nr:hypothetical protein [Acidimicrobiaceae bacterium]